MSDTPNPNPYSSGAEQQPNAPQPEAQPNFQQPNHQQPHYGANPYAYKQELPNGTTVLVLGILSLPLSLCYGIFGLILGIVTLYLAKEPRALYNANPEQYMNYSNVQAGRVCGIIAICISSIWMLLLLGYFIVIGSVIGMAAFNA